MQAKIRTGNRESYRLEDPIPDSKLIVESHLVATHSADKAGRSHEMRLNN